MHLSAELTSQAGSPQVAPGETWLKTYPWLHVQVQRLCPHLPLLLMAAASQQPWPRSDSDGVQAEESRQGAVPAEPVAAASEGWVLQQPAAINGQLQQLVLTKARDQPRLGCNCCRSRLLTPLSGPAAWRAQGCLQAAAWPSAGPASSTTRAGWCSKDGWGLGAYQHPTKNCCGTNYN